MTDTKDTVVISYSEKGRQIQEAAQKIIASWPEWKQRYAEEIIEQSLSKEESKLPRMLE